jgi:hypothetical protein
MHPHLEAWVGITRYITRGTSDEGTHAFAGHHGVAILAMVEGMKYKVPPRLVHTMIEKK